MAHVVSLRRWLSGSAHEHAPGSKKKGGGVIPSPSARPAQAYGATARLHPKRTQAGLAACLALSRSLRLTPIMIMVVVVMIVVVMIVVVMIVVVIIIVVV